MNISAHRLSTMIEDGWDLLLAGNYELALKRLRADSKRHSTKASLNNLGIAYLCVGDPFSAKTQFDLALSISPQSAGTRAFAGVARWLLEDYANAIAVWQRGLSCDFQDAAGGMKIPLLLFYGAVRQSISSSIESFKKLIQAASKHSWARNWPGPLGPYLLDMIDERELKSQAQFEVDAVTRQQLTQADFYIGVKALVEGQNKKFRAQMRRCAAAKGCESLNEWHLAQHELSKKLGSRRD